MENDKRTRKYMTRYAMRYRMTLVEWVATMKAIDHKQLEQFKRRRRNAHTGGRQWVKND
jgi:hypothetical protein